MKTSELLRRAKALLPKHFFVCHAVRGAVPIGHSKDYPRAAQVLKRIEAALKPHDTVSTWLRHKHKVPTEAMTTEAMHDYRQRWLDALIAEYEAKED